MRRSILASVVLLLVVGTVMGCGIFRGSRSGTAMTAVPLRVVNNHAQDMTIYVLRNGQRKRLGSVTSATAKEFLLGEPQMGVERRIVLIADPLGAHGQFSTEEIVVQPGQRLEWKLESNLRRSTLAIY